MGDYRNSDGFQKTYTTKDAVIASGQSLSSVIDLEQLNITGFLIPASWTTAKLTFQASPDGTTFGDVQDSSGNEIQLTVAAGKFVGVNLSELSGLRFIKVRSGTSGTPVNQGADRTISIVLTNNAEASAAASGGLSTNDGTFAKETGGNLATIAANIPAKGQAIMANSTPVAIASNQTAVPTKGDSAEQASLSAGVLNADLVPSTDVSAYKWLSIHITGTYSGTLSFQGSNDGVNFVAIPLLSHNQTNGTFATSTTSTGIVYHGPVFFKYVRIRMTSYTSGTATGTLELYTSPTAAQSLGVGAAQVGNWVAGVSAYKAAGSSANGQTISPNLSSTFGSVTNANAKSTSGNLFGFSVTNENAAKRYFQLFNKSTQPSGGDTPIYSFPLPAGSGTVPSITTIGENFFGLSGKNFSSGISWGVSTTNATFTDSATASEHNVHVHHI